MTNKQTFKSWMKDVDQLLIKICGMSHDCLADQTWYDWFQDGYEAFEAAEEALENEGFPA